MTDKCDCPGRFRCHGPASWCPVCGDVDLVCNDPQCDAHPRGNERLAAMRAANLEHNRIAAELQSAGKVLDAAQRAYRRWERGNPVMVARIIQPEARS